MNSQQKKVINWIDENKNEVVKFLQNLIQIPSVTPWFEPDPELSREGEVQQLIAQHMKGMGAKVKMWEPDPKTLSKYDGRPGYHPDHNFEGRPNLAAKVSGKGNENGKSILLTGHIDVVDPGSGWTVNPFGGEIFDGKIYGRGAVDMKGGVAAMIMAVDAIIQSGFEPSGDITIGTVVDEESGGMGTLDFVDQGFKADAAILTEATNQRVAPLCRGILHGKIVLEGRSGHIELPQGDWRKGEAVDAIKKARMLMDQIDNLNADWTIRKTHPFLKIPCQINIGKVVAGEHSSTFANKAEIYFDAQFLPSERDEFGGGGNVKSEIETFIDSVSKTDPWLTIHPPKIEWIVNADCGETNPNHEIVEVFCNNLSLLGEDTTLERSYFHTDMGWLERVGIPTINFGPGNPRVAHQNDEYVTEDELIRTTKMIALNVMEWCGVDEK